MKSLKQQLLFVGLCLLPALVLPLMGDAVGILEYNRFAITHGQWWRLVSQHWCHWSADHLFFDALAFAVLGLWAVHINLKETVLSLVISSLAISVGLFWLQPEMIVIRGLSGLDCALFGVVIVHVIRQAQHESDRFWFVVGWFALLSFVAKTAYELITHHTVFMDSVAAGIVALPLAHLIGFGVGAGVSVVMGIESYSLENRKVAI